MKNGVDFRELKEIEKKVLNGIKIKDSFSETPKTLAAFDVGYTGKKYVCVAVVINLENNEVIETKVGTGDEVMPYSPPLSAFREGPPILQTYRELENKPDVLLVRGMGSVHPHRVGLASYVGILTNKPCIGVNSELLAGKLEEDRIMFNEEIKGMAIKTKTYSNPVYVSPGHNISIQTSVEIGKKIVIEPYKLPLPLHLAHKQVNKSKKSKDTNETI